MVARMATTEAAAVAFTEAARARVSSAHARTAAARWALAVLACALSASSIWGGLVSGWGEGEGRCKVTV
jgi:hypothetical protein